MPTTLSDEACIIGIGGGADTLFLGGKPYQEVHYMNENEYQHLPEPQSARNFAYLLMGNTGGQDFRKLYK